MRTSSRVNYPEIVLYGLSAPYMAAVESACYYTGCREVVKDAPKLSQSRSASLTPCLTNPWRQSRYFCKTRWPPHKRFSRCCTCSLPSSLLHLLLRRGNQLIRGVVREMRIRSAQNKTAKIIPQNFAPSKNFPLFSED